MGQAFDREGNVLGEEFGSTEIELPRYRSHKVVWALKIAKIVRDGEGEDQPRETDGTAMIVPDDVRYAPLKVSAEYVRKHKPRAGGYYVRYADGYESWSPAEAFESGYTKL